MCVWMSKPASVADQLGGFVVAFTDWALSLLGWHRYGTEEACWLDWDDGTIWAFLGPLCCVVGVNIFIFIKILQSVISVGLEHVEHKRRAQLIRGLVLVVEVEKGRDVVCLCVYVCVYVCVCMCVCVCVCVCVPVCAVTSHFAFVSPRLPPLLLQFDRAKVSASFFCIMGMTWVFGILAISGDLAMQYLFAILNSFQGVFIFVFHCWRDQTVRQTIIGRVEPLPSEMTRSSRVTRGTQPKATKLQITRTYPTPASEVELSTMREETCA